MKSLHDQIVGTNITNDEWATKLIQFSNTKSVQLDFYCIYQKGTKSQLFILTNGCAMKLCV